MKILALETSTNACSAALINGNQQDYTSITRFEIAPRRHTQLILPMLDSILDQAELDIKQIDVLAFGRGPGAFTGVRVGTGVIQALAYGADIPVAQISSLSAVAQRFYRAQVFSSQSQTNSQTNSRSFSKNSKVLVANDARMDEIYFSAYEYSDGFMTLIGEEQVMKPHQLDEFLQQLNILPDEQCTIVGNGWLVYAEQLSEISKQCKTPLFDKDYSIENSAYPYAEDIAFLAFREIEQENLVAAEQVGPVYLRDNIAKKAVQKAAQKSQ